MTDRSSHICYDPDRFPHFESPHFYVVKMPNGCYFDDIAYNVSGRTRAENHLITIAQAELLSCMLMNKGLCDHLQRWSASVGLLETEHDIADFLDRVAQRLGLSQRADLGRARPATPQALIEDLLPEWYRLQDCLYTAYGRAGEVFKAACLYVCDELQQPWAWLAARLTEHVFEQAWERALGIRMVSTRTSYLDEHIWESPVQPFSFVFEARPNETAVQIKRRLMAEAREACANIPVQGTLPKGIVRKDREQKTQRNTRWLYQHLICGETKYNIAKPYHSLKHKRGFPCRKCQDFIGKGINAACTLLDMAAYHF